MHPKPPSPLTQQRRAATRRRFALLWLLAGGALSGFELAAAQTPPSTAEVSTALVDGAPPVAELPTAESARELVLGREMNPMDAARILAADGHFEAALERLREEESRGWNASPVESAEAAEWAVRCFRPTEALTRLRRATGRRELTPADAPAFLRLGDAWLMQYQWDDAMKSYRETIRLDNAACEAKSRLGIGARARRHWEKELAAYADALTCDPAHVWTRTRRAEVLLRLHDFEEARTSLAVVTKDLRTTDSLAREAALFAGVAAWRAGQNDQARAAREQLAAMHGADTEVSTLDRLLAGEFPTDSPTPASRINALLKSGAELENNNALAEAAVELTLADVLAPGDDRALHARGRVYSKLGDLTRSRTDLSRSILAFDRNWEALQTRGFVCLEAGRPDEAVIDFRRTVALRPQSCLAWFGLGIAENRCGRFTAALAAFAEYEKCDGDVTVDVRLERAHAYRQLGLPAQALGELDAAAGSDPAHCDVARMRAQLLLDEGKAADACEALRAAKAGGCDDADALARWLGEAGCEAPVIHAPTALSPDTGAVAAQPPASATPAAATPLATEATLAAPVPTTSATATPAATHVATVPPLILLPIPIPIIDAVQLTPAPSHTPASLVTPAPTPVVVVAVAPTGIPATPAPPTPTATTPPSATPTASVATPPPSPTSSPRPATPTPAPTLPPTRTATATPPATVAPTLTPRSTTAAPAPAPKKVLLRIESATPGTFIAVDGRYVGEAPVSVTGAVGVAMTITALADDHLLGIWTAKPNGEADSPTLKLDLGGRRSTTELLDMRDPLQQALEREPRNPLLLVQTAEVARTAASYGLAEALARSAVEVAPTCALAKKTLGICLANRAREAMIDGDAQAARRAEAFLQESRRVLEEALVESYGASWALVARATPEIVAEKRDTAMAYYRKAREIDPKCLPAILGLGLNELRTAAEAPDARRKAAALTACAAFLDEASAIDPNYSQLLSARAGLARERGDAEASRAFATRVAEYDPMEASAHVVLGTALADIAQQQIAANNAAGLETLQRARESLIRALILYPTDLQTRGVVEQIDKYLAQVGVR